MSPSTKGQVEPVNEPRERLTATMEEHLKIPHKRDRNVGARAVRMIFKPIQAWVHRLEKTPRGREALGFIALTIT